MTTKAEFNAEEWSTIVEGAVLAGLRVAGAARWHPPESIAMGRIYAEARKQHGESELLDELVAAPPALDPGLVRSPGDLGRVSTERLRKAVELLEQKASAEEVDAYKRFVLTLADAAAKAHREGGFIGIGGKEVSESERAALDEIAGTGVSPGGQDGGTSPA